jgi:mono/diheme cytochrome c family protein
MRPLVFASVLFTIAVALVPAAPAQDQAVVIAGEDLYDEHCQICHGEKLRNPGHTFDLRGLTADDRQRFDRSVMQGKGQMPPWRGTLAQDDLDALWAYIRSRAYDR